MIRIRIISSHFTERVQITRSGQLFLFLKYNLDILYKKEKRREGMKPKKLTTEDTEKKKFRFFKSSVNSVVAPSQKEYPWIKVWVY